VRKFRFNATLVHLIVSEARNLILNRNVKSVYADSEKMEIAITFSSGYTLYAKVRQPHIRMHLTENRFPPTPDWTNVLKKHKLVEIEQVDNDRIVLLKFRRKNPLGEMEELYLYLELTGRYGNAILVKNGKVLKILKENLSPERTLKPGSPFIPYPTKPSEIHIPDKLEPAICMEDGKPTLILENPSEECIRYPTLSSAIEAYFNAILTAPEEKKEVQERGRIEEIERLEKRLSTLQEEAENLFQAGNHIMSNLHVLNVGDEIEVAGRKLKLDDHPARVAGRLFEEYKRLKKGMEKLRQRIEELKRSERVIRDIREEGGKTQEKGESHSSRYYRIYESPSGFRVYVGKSARGNDYLLSKVAKPDDLWFHVKDNPGSHVIMKTGGVEPSPQDIEFAARLALENSKAASSGKGLVSMTRVKYLRKPKGAPPGMVLLTREETIPIRLDN